MWKSAIRELIGMLRSNSPGWTTSDLKAKAKPAWREYLRSSADERRESCLEEEVEEEEGEEESGDDEDISSDDMGERGSRSDEESAERRREHLDEEDPESIASYQSATIHARKSSQRDKLFAAIEAADYAAVERILLVGIVDVNTFDANRIYTPLMAACKGAQPDIARLCLQFGATVDVKSGTGHSAMHFAAECGSCECAQAMLSAALHQARGTVLANIKNNEGQTPLMVAAEYGESAVVKLLLAHGGDITACDKKRKTCLHLCASYGHETCLAILLDSGADGVIDAKDMFGNTALHYSAKYGHIETTRLLLETAADPLVRNKNSRTPYDLASEQKHEEVCSLLFDYMSSSSPLNSARKGGQSTVNTSPILTPKKPQSARSEFFR